MTRQGTVAYYLAAWVIGCPVVALVIWLTESVEHGMGTSSELLEFCFFALMCGAIDVLLFAFILRRAMRSSGARKIAIWTLSGAVLALGLVFCLVWLGDRVSAAGIQRGPGYFLYAFLFAGPAAMWSSGWWQAALDGAAIGAVLSLVDLAFNPARAPETAAGPDEGQAAPARQSPA